MGFHPMYGYYSTGDRLWSIISTVLFIGLLTLAITLLVRVLLARALSGPGQPGAKAAQRPFGTPPWRGPGSSPEPSAWPGSAGSKPAWSTPEAGAEADGAERIPAERYARGEIAVEDYQGKLEVLRRVASGWPTQQGPYLGTTVGTAAGRPILREPGKSGSDEGMSCRR